MNKQPSKFFSRLFERFCNDSFYEELQGDLEEKFYVNLEEKGIEKAKSIYRREVIKMVRPSVIRKTQHSTRINSISMFKNYSIIAFRNLIRNKLFSSINIIGLSISMAAGLLAITFASEIYSFDTFHENKDRIYRIVSDDTQSQRGTSLFATTSILTGKRLVNDFAAFEHIALINRGLYGNLTSGEKSISIQGIYTNNDFFKVFSFKMIYGNPETALTEPYSILLTEETALKIFGKTDVVGETLVHSSNDILKVTGVVADPPRNSHIDFDAIAALETLERKNSYVVNYWTAITSSYIYGLVPQGTRNLDPIQANLDQVAKEENEKLEGRSIELSLEALNDIFPGEERLNQFKTFMPKSMVNSIVIMALVIILSACFNYTNLSTARSLKRAKEVGIRKVVGAHKFQLIFQFVIESVLTSLFALLFAFFLFRLFRPEFISLDYYIQSTTTLELKTATYVYFILFAIVIGALAGFLPALLMSNFKPVKILKGTSFAKTNKGFGFSKIITGLQFTLSMGFLILVSLIFKQYKFALNYDLGFTTENVVNVQLHDSNAEILKPLFGQIPEVLGVSSSSRVSSTGGGMSAHAKALNAEDSIVTYTFDISHDYIENLDHQLVAGFGLKEGLEKDKAVVNELFVKRIGFKSPQDAIGQPITFSRQKYTIVGVVKDFHYMPINQKLEPFIFTSRGQHHILNIKLSSEDIVGTMNKLASIWSRIHPDTPFQARFYEDDLERTYADVSSSIKTYGVLSFIAISISILGLFGMAVYTTESKRKELTVRKILGAKISHLLIILSKNFLLTFIISAAVAIPTAYLMFQRTIVQDTIYTINVGFWELSGGAVLIIIIAFLTIGSQTLKAARSNPAQELRNE